MNKLILMVCSCLFLLTACKKDKSSPNIIVIITDDQGYGDLTCYGASGFQTPHIDQLAAEGMRFTHFYATQAVCSASRAALLTGCYPNRIGMTGAIMPFHNYGLNPEETTIAEMLKEEGYATAMFGKWHLGHHYESLPLQNGFDEFIGLPYSNDMWSVDFDGKPAVAGKSKPLLLQFPPLPFMIGNETVRNISTLADQDKLTTIYTEAAVAFIKEQKKNPFFLYIPHSMPHAPLGVSNKFRGKSKQGLYGDVMMEIDWSVGQVMKTLQAEGLKNNTLVIFTSDNGPWLNFGNHAGSTGGLREGKGVSFEGGQRVPCIMSWPEVIPQGVVSNQLAANIDIISTISAICKARLPNHRIDGINLLPILQQEEGAEPRSTLLYYYKQNDLEAIRYRTWKLVFPHTHRSYEGVLPQNDGWPGEYAFGEVTEKALYHLQNDPGERYNVISQHPDIVSKILEIANDARVDLGDNLTGVKGLHTREKKYYDK